MYIAKLKNRVIEGGNIRWVVEFSNGTEIFTDSFKMNKFEDLQPTVARKLAELNFVDTFTINATIDSTVPAQPIKTQAELDRNEWLNDWRVLQNADKLVASGVIVNTLPAYVSHKAKVVTNFKPAYINFL